MQSDVSAIISLLSHIWMAPVVLGATAVALFGHLSYPMVVLVLEGSRGGCIITLGAFNASYIVQFITIFDHSWINSFTDRQVILFSMLCALSHYSFYVPDLIMVKFNRFLNKLKLLILSETYWVLSFSNQRPLF